MTRSPVVAGMFYPEDFGELDNKIRDNFEGKFGPGSLPLEKRDKNVLGVIVPHAGYQFSGGCAAWAYKEVAEAPIPDVYIILGVDHAGIGNNCVSTEDWETPFGIVKTDAELAKKLVDNKVLFEDNRAHYNEHSIEVQLPFLQFINNKRLNEFKIIAIMISTTDYPAIAERIFKVLRQENKKALFICSSDFTHHGVNYRFMRFKDNIKEEMYEFDKQAINFIEKIDILGFNRFVRENKATICGYRNIAVLMKIMQLNGFLHGKLLRYYTSADVAGDYNNAVGYGAILFGKNA
ncbi:AmmeMemoRadiSam system protein B [Candidatus Woesearchaeota archaeon]|nr:AmmeMemoRadiSam system protein B [Candidatus Woesearchaeota archaeon]